MNTTIKQPGISFGYSNIIKTLYKSDKLPSVKYDFYGSKLTRRNCTLDHLIPYSKGGKTKLNNLVLASKENNQARGSKSIIYFFDAECVRRYLNQFIGVKQSGFNGNDYINQILKTLERIFNKGG